MSSVMKAMQAAHKAQKLEERAAEEKRLAEHQAERDWRGDPKRKEQLIKSRKDEKKATPKKKAAAKKTTAKKKAPKKKAVKKKSAAKKG
jgi:nucleoid-associated protein YgaU|tara:strand:+ start:136 stop:402 length:267 start_codon:yes stop_codon:yes gene_type:complete